MSWIRPYPTHEGLANRVRIHNGWDLRNQMESRNQLDMNTNRIYIFKGDA